MEDKVISLFNVEELGHALEAEIMHPREIVCTGVSTDSRKVVPGDLFLALKGERFDAHEFLGQAVGRGCRAVVVSKDVSLPEDVVIFRVADVEKSFGYLARKVIEKRRSLGGFMTYGLTGSNGKTTTKELLAALLAAKGHSVLKTEGNNNNFIGLPMTALKLTTKHDAAVFEMGANAPGEIKYLSDIAEPEYGLITGVGAAHLGGFGSLEGVARTKGELIHSPRLKKVVLPAYTRQYYEKTLPSTVTVTWVGEGESVYVEGVESNVDGTEFVMVWGDEKLPIHLPLLGGHNASNFAIAATLVREAGWTAAELNRAVSGVVLPSGRLERWDASNRVQFLHDAYNANPSSMGAALNLMAEVVEAGRRCLILGDMRELGEASDALHRSIGRRAAEIGVKCLLCVGESAKYYREGALEAGLSDEKIFCTAQDALEPGLKWLSDRFTEGDVCLIKGSRGVALERVLSYFEATRHV